jgi:hypothetical protein
VEAHNLVYEYEMALLANLTPERADEAMALVPSLKVGVCRARARAWCCALSSAWLCAHPRCVLSGRRASTLR